MARIKNIIVDLDGTLIDFDSSFKMWKSLFRLNFFPLLKVLFIYIVYGEARAKSSFHKISTLNYTLNQNLLQYLYKMKPGISHVKGGINVLYDMNYPDEIIKSTIKKKYCYNI